MGLTGQFIVNQALTALGILDQGGVPSASDSNDALNELNQMELVWGVDEGLIPAVQKIAYALAAATNPIPLGPAAPAPWSIPVPARVYSPAFVTVGGVRHPVRIVDQQTYNLHGDPTASALVPDELYIDWNVISASGNINLYQFPVASGTPVLELECAAPYITWTLQGTFAVPQGYQDAIPYALAYRLIPRFGVAIQPQVAEAVTALAQKAEARIREMNSINRILKGQQGALPGTPGTPAAPQMPGPPAPVGR